MVVKVINDDLLREIAERCWCEKCCKRHPMVVDPAHIIARGMGNGSRVDVEENLVGLCRTHHNQHHSGHIKQSEMWAMAAKRLGKTAEECRLYVYLILRTPKEQPAPLPVAIPRVDVPKDRDIFVDD